MMKFNWLASYPKSGNTWCRAVLDAYKTGDIDINSMSSCTSDNLPYFYTSLSPDKDLSKEERRLIRPAALLHLSRLPLIRPMVVKTHYANVVIDDIAMIPKAISRAAVYVVRDPRDVAISYSKHFGYSVDEAIQAMEDRNRTIVMEDMEHVTGDWSLHVKSWACEKHIPVLVLKYEQMLSDPMRAFGSMLSYFGVEVDENRLRKAVELTAFDKLKAQEKENGFREVQNGEFFNTGRSTWKDTLTPEQIRRIEATHGEVMDEFGYTRACGDIDRRDRDDPCDIANGATYCAA